MQITRFFDQILAQIEVGHAKSALTQLSGMLDAINMSESGLDEACDALHQHDLFTLFKGARFGAEKGNPQNRAVPWILTRGDQTNGLDPSTRMLAKAMQDLPPVHAILKREDHAMPIIMHAWQRGRSICLSGGNLSTALCKLGRRDLSNISICGPNERDDPSLRQHYLTLDDALSGSETYDLIYTPDLLFETKPADLAATVSRLVARLAPFGTALLTSLTPGHLGSGWRKLCLGWYPNCHADQSLIEAAQLAGAKVRIYSDPEGCILWCEVMRGDVSMMGGTS